MTTEKTVRSFLRQAAKNLGEVERHIQEGHPSIAVNLLSATRQLIEDSAFGGER